MSTYCTGTLNADLPLARPVGVETWQTDPALTAKSGATFLVGRDFGKFAGYVFQPDGTPTQLVSSSGLKVGTDFASSCAGSPEINDRFVLLANATLYATAGLTGAPCTVPLGAASTDYGVLGSSPASFGGSLVSSACGYSPGYTNSLVDGHLLPR